MFIALYYQSLGENRRIADDHYRILWSLVIGHGKTLEIKMFFLKFLMVRNKIMT